MTDHGNDTAAVHCERCGGTKDVSTAEFYLTPAAGGPAFVRDVPAHICRQCGNTTFRLSVIAAIERQVAARPEPIDRITVPVYVLPTTEQPKSRRRMGRRPAASR